jgi:hypothetical protein
MNPLLKRLMRGLTVAQTAYILGVHENTVRKWQEEPINDQGLKTLEYFFLLSPMFRESIKQQAREACPNQGGRVY